jgi:hypothetical protein
MFRLLVLGFAAGIAGCGEVGGVIVNVKVDGLESVDDRGLGVPEMSEEGGNGVAATEGNRPRRSAMESRMVERATNLPRASFRRYASALVAGR